MYGVREDILWDIEDSVTRIKETQKRWFLNFDFNNKEGIDISTNINAIKKLNEFTDEILNEFLSYNVYQR